MSLLAGLPNHWYAYTNLDLAVGPGSSREIDVIIVAEDRILVVDLKDWRGPIESRDGHWFNDGHDNGRSPVRKILKNAHEVFLQLQAHLKRHAKGRHVVPKVQGLVVLTGSGDMSGIAESELRSVMPIAAFTSALKSVPKRIQTFGAAPPDAPLTDQAWRDQLSKFFNVTKGVFAPGRRLYGGYYASSSLPVFEHPEGIYAEFDATDERASPTLGVLRLWDFTKAEARFQTEAGRGQIAGREQEVIAYLRDRSDDCDEVIVDSRARDPDYGPQYWEVYDRRSRLHRLLDVAGTDLAEATRGDRIELARQLLASVNALHLAEAAHLDLGQHSIWLQRPSTVRLSHLMASSYPDVRSLGEARFQFLSSGRLPEDEFGDDGGPKRRDVFLAACAMHRILLGVWPAAANGWAEWNPAADAAGEFGELHGWFERAMAWEPGVRPADAAEALAEFNAATAVRPTPAEVLAGLDRYRGKIRSQIQLYAAYPPDGDVLLDDETRARWRSRRDGRELLVKLWKREAWGDQQREGPRILDFLDRVAELHAAEPEGCPKVVDAMWLGDAIVMVQEWVDLPDLAEVMSAQSPEFHEEGRLALVAGLADRVERLHELRLAHGDLKPSNVLVDESAWGAPMLIDLMDFAPSGEGDVISRRYAPEVGGRYERDCFAITRIAEELLEGVSTPAAVRVREAVAAIRLAEVPNATLLPLMDAVTHRETEPAVVERITLLSPHASAGALLPDEGRYFLRKAKWRRSLIVRGACEEIEVALDPSDQPVSLERRSVDQGRIRSLARVEFGHIEAAIAVEKSDATDLRQLASLMERADVKLALSQASALRDGEVDEPDGSAERETPRSEPPEDGLVEAIAASPQPTGDIDVARLWQALIEAEGELINEGQATGDAIFDGSVNLYRLEFDLVSGSLDFNRADRVLVEREDRNGSWRPIGHLDLQRSKPDSIWIDSFRPHQRGAPPLVEQGRELRFRSWMEQKSLDRRRAAVRRIVERSSRVRDLIDVLDPRIGRQPRSLSDRVDPARLKETYGLNDEQAAALSAALSTRPLVLTQGPPGTGKTVFIAALVHAALTLGLARNVLLASQAHEAVNNAAEAVLKLFAKAGDVPSIIRIGAEGVVSDRLLPFHVERVERLQKDRFRSEMRERLEAAALALGIAPEVAAHLARIEMAVRPVAARIAELESGPADAARVASLRETVALQIEPLGLDPIVVSDAPGAEMMTIVATELLRRLPHAERPSGDKVARFQSIASLARDFVGSVSTEHRSFETFLAGTRQIVAGTCVGLGRSTLGLTSTPFDLVVVDEAARCTASELAVPIQAGGWIVLVGDHEQLQPQHPGSVVEDVAGRMAAGEAEVARSDFERVFGTVYGRAAGHTLTRQYRMLPAIGRLVSNAFYNGRLEHGRVDPVVDPAVLPADLAKPLVWVDTGPLGKRGEQGTPNQRMSLSNVAEADAIVALLKGWSECEPFVGWLGSQTAHAHAIGIICAYSAQRDLVRRKIALAPISQTLRDALKVDTIDSYQGKENPIVIVSLVRNNSAGPWEDGKPTIRPGFLSRPNRINVAMSRAMDRLVLVGSRGRWAAGGPMSRIATAFVDAIEGGDAEAVGADVLLGRSPPIHAEGDDAAAELEMAR